jgi:hypothetical protein
MVFDVAGEMCPSVDPSLHEEWKRECQWVSDSMQQQFLTFPEKGETHKVTQGAFTGFRGIGFINDRLHCAYWRLAMKTTCRILKTSYADFCTRIRGDDVISLTDQWVLIGVMMAVLIKMGFSLNAAKQLISREYGVFLRVLYTESGMLGYAARSIGSFVLQPLQAQERTDVQARVTAMDNHIHLLVRRGFRSDIADSLWYETMSYWARLEVDSRVGHYIKIPMATIVTSASRGGWGCSPPIGIDHENEIAIPSFPVIQRRADQIKEITGNDMSSGYASIIAGRFQGNVIADEARELAAGYKEENVVADATPRDQANSWRSYIKEVREWTAKHKRSLSSARHTRLRNPGRYVIAPPGSGKSFMCKWSWGRNLVDGDLVVGNRKEWERFTSPHLKTRMEARVRYCEKVIKLVRQGKIVLAAHIDAVILEELGQARIPVVRVVVENRSRLEALLRREGRINEQMEFNVAMGVKSHLANRSTFWNCVKKLPLAASLEQAVNVRYFGEFVDYRHIERESQYFRLVGVRLDARGSGEYLYLDKLPMTNISELAEVTALRSVGRIEMAAKYRGCSFLTQFGLELSNVNKGMYAGLLRSYGQSLRSQIERKCGLNSDVINKMQPGMQRGLMAYYWSCATAKYLSSVSNEGASGRSEEMMVEDAIRVAFWRDEAGLLNRV